MVETGLYRSADELEAALEDASTRQFIQRHLSLAGLLRRCIIGQNFKVPDDWVAAIDLTELGESVVAGTLASDRKVRPNEAKFAAFLKVGTPEGLLVSLDTDLEALQGHISIALLDQDVLLASTFGRELQDEAASRYPEQAEFDNAKSVRLLESLPVGVCQSGWYVTGPYGCLVSDSYRHLPPVRSVPGFYCGDISCPRIHSLHLTTAQTAPINRAIPALRDYVRGHMSGLDEFAKRVNRRFAADRGDFRHFNGAAALEAIADGLNRDEIELVVAAALKAKFRDRTARLTLLKQLATAVANPDDFVRSLSREELLQILLLQSDEALWAALDSVLHDEALIIPGHEVRKSQLSRVDRVAEIGAFGLRMRPTPEFPPASLCIEVLDAVFLQANAADELAFLGGVDEGADPNDVLDVVVRKHDTTAIVDDFLLSSKATADRSADFFWVSEPYRTDRESLRAVLLWRLGAPGALAFSELGLLDRRAADLLRVIQSGKPEEAQRGAATNLWTVLESTLHRALCFTVWALSTDHFVSADGFEYDPTTDEETIQLLEKLAPATEGLALSPDGRNTLAPLGAGFGRLARVLDGLTAVDCERPSSQFPAESAATGRPFAFSHTQPVFWLSDEAQGVVIGAIRTLASMSQGERLLRVRNTSVHGNTPFPSSEELAWAADEVTRLAEQLRRFGLFPTVFEREATEVDSAGRSTTTYSAGDQSLSLHGPTRTLDPRLPFSSRQLVIMPAAQIPGCGPLRFTLKPNPRRDEYWDGWPRQWKVRANDGYGPTDAGSTMEPSADSQSAAS